MMLKPNSSAGKSLGKPLPLRIKMGLGLTYHPSVWILSLKSSDNSNVSSWLAKEKTLVDVNLTDLPQTITYIVDMPRLASEQLY